MLPHAALLLVALATQLGPPGAVTTDFDRREDSAEAVAVQPDGKLVLAGTSSAPAEDRASFALSRYAADGSLDPGFGGDGTVTTDFGSFADGASDVLVQPDGRIVAVGSAVRESDDRLAVARYLPDGALDPSFGGDGSVSIAEARGFNGCLTPASVALQPDGRLVVAGTEGCGGEAGFTKLLVVRLQPDGRLDGSFDGDGRKSFDFGPCAFGNAVALQLDGKIIVAGGDGNCYEERGPFRVARLNADGTFDHRFGRRGRQQVRFPAPSAWVDDVMLDTQGRIVLVGSAGGRTRSRRFRFTFALARLTPAGALDRRFGRRGIWMAPRPGRRDTYASAGALLRDGRIVVVGTRSPFSKHPDSRIALYRQEGALDRSFRRGGAGRVGFGGRRESANALAIDAEGRLVVVGSSELPGTSFDFGLTRLAAAS